MKLNLHNKIGLALICTVALVLASALWLLASGKQLEEIHRPYSYTDSFDYQHSASFADFISWSQQRLRSGRVDQPDAQAMNNLSPFRMEPAANCAASTSGKMLNGVVLTHDLMDSPYTMRTLAQYLNQRCFLVLGLLLPEHGTRPGDLLATDWQAWAEAESFAARILGQEVENVFLGGHGSGATLALLESTSNAEVDGLLLFAPSLSADSAPWYSWFAQAFATLIPATGWISELPDEAIYRYTSQPYKLASEADALTRATLKALPDRPFEIPVFTVASMEDNSSNTEAMLAFMAERTHAMSRTLLYSKHEMQAPPGVTIFNTWYPEQTVLSLAHPGLVIPMYDPQFGWDGKYRDCTHYYRQNAELYQRCHDGGREVYGETTPENLQQGVLERIGFNPFYQDMFRSIDEFLSPVLGSVSAREER